MCNGIIRPLQSRDIESAEIIFHLYWSGTFLEHLLERLKSPPPDFKWIVAEEDGEIVGVAASRPAPERMRQYAKTDNVIEFYIAAAKYKGKGVGTALRNMRINEAKKKGYEEAVLFSAESHQDSWSFHDASAFRRVGEAIAPDGERGYIWLMDLT